MALFLCRGLGGECDELSNYQESSTKTLRSTKAQNLFKNARRRQTTATLKDQAGNCIVR